MRQELGLSDLQTNRPFKDRKSVRVKHVPPTLGGTVFFRRVKTGWSPPLVPRGTCHWQTKLIFSVSILNTDISILSLLISQHYLCDVELWMNFVGKFVVPRETFSREVEFKLNV
jgi:hypothetical protein